MTRTKRSTVLVADIPAIVNDPERGIVSIVGTHGGLSLITGPQQIAGSIIRVMLIESEHGVICLDPDTKVEISEEWPKRASLEIKNDDYAHQHVVTNDNKETHEHE